MRFEGKEKRKRQPLSNWRPEFFYRRCLSGFVLLVLSLSYADISFAQHSIPFLLSPTNYSFKEHFLVPLLANTHWGK